MDYVAATENFSFEFPSPTLDGSLIVGAEIWDISTSTPALLDQIQMDHVAGGIYHGSFLAAANKTYMVICLVFADAGGGVADFDSPDTAYPPKTIEKQAAGLTSPLIVWDYTDFDHSAALHVRAALYETTLGTTSFVSFITMTHVAHGAYLGRYSPPGFDRTYLVSKLVYTSGAFSALDDQRLMGAESFVVAALGLTQITNIFGGEDLDGSFVDEELETLC